MSHKKLPFHQPQDQNHMSDREEQTSFIASQQPDIAMKILNTLQEEDLTAFYKKTCIPNLIANILNNSENKEGHRQQFIKWLDEMPIQNCADTLATKGLLKALLNPHDTRIIELIRCRLVEMDYKTMLQVTKRDSNKEILAEAGIDTNALLFSPNTKQSTPVHLDKR